MNPSFVEHVIEMAVENVRRGGGPFAALVVRDGSVIATGANRVTSACDPTAHAEIVAIREACRILGSFQLPACELYTSCEPCPMCLGAIYWARPARVYYAATQDDAAAAGFDDSFIYREIAVPPARRAVPMIHVDSRGAASPFEEWKGKPDKSRY
jgi:guanine deaminase